MSNKNCLVAQSGGPTAVINASLAGVIHAAFESSKIDTVYGAIHGIQGVLQGHIFSLNNTFKNNSKSIHSLKTTPAMYLGSCRYKLPAIDTNTEEYDIIFETLKKLNIGYFVYIGGNDSMDTVNKLSKYAKKINVDIKIIGVPKTIDNDLFGTDHTPGFGSAAKFVATTMLEIAHDTYIYNVESVTIVEIMGRNAGWLTAASALARTEYSSAPHLIYLPESKFIVEEFLEDIQRLIKEKKNVIVAVSEGIKNENGEYVSATSASTDKFGHAQLSGTSEFLKNLIKERIGCKVRAIELNVLQRSAMHVASLTDINEAFNLGEYAIKLCLEGVTDRMLTIQRIGNSPYEVKYETITIDKAANTEKNVPLHWINAAGNDITNELLEYLQPLIIGEPTLQYKNGIPEYLPVTHLMKTV